MIHYSHQFFTRRGISLCIFLKDFYNSGLAYMWIKALGNKYSAFGFQFRGSCKALNVFQLIKNHYTEGPSDSRYLQRYLLSVKSQLRGCIGQNVRQLDTVFVCLFYLLYQSFLLSFFLSSHVFRSSCLYTSSHIVFCTLLYHYCPWSKNVDLCQETVQSP